MFQPQSQTTREARRGVVLMVVLILLTLFSIVALSFVLYADAEAKSAQINREAEVAKQPDVDPEMLLSFFLGQLVYDQDNQSGVYSAMRGGSLARSAFGSNDMAGATNLVAFNGTGRLRGSTSPLGASGVDDSNIVNYTYNPADAASGIGIIDPEHTMSRPGPSSPYAPGSTYFGINAPYTYPDLNNMYLAAVRPDGTVLLPSFHRYWNPAPPSTAAPFGSLSPLNPNWYIPSSTNPALKYLVLRPRPIDHLLPNEVWDAVKQMPYNTVTLTHRPNFFPAPEDGGGDVKNLVGGPGFYDASPAPIGGVMANNDSFWMDLGAPEMTAPDGRKFKALFAPLIFDLDHCVNLNVHGNIRGTGNTHVSNQGWGPWTVNLGQVMTQPQPTPTEWTNLFLGTSTPTAIGRYGLDKAPGTAGAAAPWSGFAPSVPATAGRAHFYNHIDADGCDINGNPTQPFSPVGSALSCFPSYPTSISNPAVGGYDDASAGELTNHPLNFLSSGSDDRVFDLSNMEALLRFGDTGSANLTSDLLRLCPLNFSDARIRRLVTLSSFDIDSPGVTPWLYSSPPSPYQLTTTGINPAYPVGGAIGFPSTSAAATAPPTEFGNVAGAPDYRSIIAALGRLDLNRPLPDYPQPSGGLFNSSAATSAQFMAAQTARQDLAKDIFVVLLQTTGSMPATFPAVPSPAYGDNTYNALRWLAQLAVNIVDFIDDDDYMTPFFWNPMAPSEVVFGTELPRIVINEAYAQWTKKPAGTATPVSVWVELLNTFNTDTSLWSNGELTTASGNVVYQLLLCQPDATLPAPAPASPNPPPYYRRADNVWGTPYPLSPPTDKSMVYQTSGGMDALVNTWTATSIAPSNGGAAGYYLVGHGTITGSTMTPDTDSANMAYQIPTPADNQAPSCPDRNASAACLSLHAAKCHSGPDLQPVYHCRLHAIRRRRSGHRFDPAQTMKQVQYRRIRRWPNPMGGSNHITGTAPRMALPTTTLASSCKHLRQLGNRRIRSRRRIWEPSHRRQITIGSFIWIDS